MKNLKNYNEYEEAMSKGHQAFEPLTKLIEANLSDINLDYNNSACYPTHADWDIRVNHHHGFMEWGSPFQQVSITHKKTGRRGICTIHNDSLACLDFYN